MIKLIVAGSITQDIILAPRKDEKRFIGGVPVYAASAAKALGETIGIVSKVGTDFPVKNLKVINSLEADLNGFKISGQNSMVFENKYNSRGKRTQKVLSVSEKITFDDIPSVYLQAPCIHLGPVFNEIDLDMIPKVRESFDFVSLEGQGFTRNAEKKSKKIVHEPWINYDEYLPQLDILKVDDTELKSITSTLDLEEAIQLALDTGLKLLVITLADKGAIIFHENVRYDIPAIPTDIIDETGAGDTFIITFLLEYLRTKDCHYSGLVAASAASYKIATSGPIPNHTREDIISRLRDFDPEFKEK
ncbi:MAG: hypothetical protein HZR80_01760 [Candidatus Heimdallarchaeota archaeon]